MLDDLHNILSDPKTMQFWPQPFTREQSEQWLKLNQQSWAETGIGRLAIRLKSTGELIGDAGIKQTIVNDRAENDIGYIIHHPYWKQGFGIEAAKAVLDYGFEVKKLTRIIANMPHNHLASAKIAEKLGMKKDLEFYNTRNRNMLTFLYVQEK